MKGKSVCCHGWFNLALDTWRRQESAFGLLRKAYAKCQGFSGSPSLRQSVWSRLKLVPLGEIARNS